MKYIIYKIQLNDFIYIGSTQNFTLRKSQHKSNCNNGKDLLVYRIIRDNGGWECCTMIPVKEIDVKTIMQARILEEEVRIQYNAQMNSIRAYQTEEQKKDYHKEYAQTEANKDYRKKYHQSEVSKTYQKEYQKTEEYKEYQKQYQKQYRLTKKANLKNTNIGIPTYNSICPASENPSP